MSGYQSDRLSDVDTMSATVPDQLDKRSRPGIGRWLPQHPLSWIVLVTAALYLYRRLGDWMLGAGFHFDIRSLLWLLYYLLCGVTVWACIRYLAPLLQRRGWTLIPRLILGSVALIAGITAFTFLVYAWLFPSLMGRAVYFAGLFDTSHQAFAIALVIHGWLLMDREAQAQAQRALQVQLETDALSTDLDRAELAVLQTQIEPHFLFNTLAHIKRQYRLEQPAADQLMSQLIDYLQRALPALRRQDWTLGDEMDLVRSYLGIQQQRFAERLHFEIDLPAHCASRRLPALTVATLVENAVRHGLAPKAGQGRIAITVSVITVAVLARVDVTATTTADGNDLLIAVRDDGVGLLHTSGNGLGLATVRARLRGAFRQRAQLTVEPNSDPAFAGGVCASIRLPAECDDAR